MECPPLKNLQPAPNGILHFFYERLFGPLVNLLQLICIAHDTGRYNSDTDYYVTWSLTSDFLAASLKLVGSSPYQLTRLLLVYGADTVHGSLARCIRSNPLLLG